MIRDIQAESLHARVAEVQSSMIAMGDGIQRRFETLEGAVWSRTSAGSAGPLGDSGAENRLQRASAGPAA